jgi:hypothetical protein
MGAEPHQGGNTTAENEGYHNEWSVREPLYKFDMLKVSFTAQNAERPTMGRQTRSPKETRLSARPEYVATSFGGTSSDSRTGD